MSFQERRAHPRTLFSAPFMFVLPNGMSDMGKIVDISTGGMRFKSETVLEAGDIFTSDLPFPNQHTYSIQGIILEKKGNGPYIYRVSFTQETIHELQGND